MYKKCFKCEGFGLVSNTNYDDFCERESLYSNLNTPSYVKCDKCGGTGKILTYDDYWDNYRG